MKTIGKLKEGDKLYILDLTYGYYNQYIVNSIFLNPIDRIILIHFHDAKREHSDEIIEVGYTGARDRESYIMMNDKKSKRMLLICTSKRALRSRAREFSRVLKTTSQRLKGIVKMIDDDSDLLDKDGYRFYF